ncbi:HD domain-containing protein [Furfurilactobacillus entadae]|uniref:HD domain-containing protein n=1 Tax=Furfurilactobacillus entadae TaxID=2922307 RepID=UPI0035E6D43B
MKPNEWKQDAEYVALVSDLLARPEVQRLADFTQHHNSTRLEHCLSVSFDSYQIAKRRGWDYQAVARAGLLHDLFYYDWRTTKFDLGTHAFIHPRVSLRNAEKLTELSDLEKDIILKHMFGLTMALPKYKESLLVSLVDDYEAVHEYGNHTRRKWRTMVQRLQLKFS